MKKYFLLSLILLFLAAPVFAQIPSFEISPQSGPTISNASVTKSISDIIITATITDISGISSAMAIIKYASGTEKERVFMLDDGAHPDGIAGNGIYGFVVSILNYPPDSYTVDISAVDNLAFPSQLTNAGNFEKTAGNCQSNQGASICVSISPTANLNQISSFTVNPSTSLAGTTVTLTADLSGVSGQTIIFTDQTASVNIGSAVTDSSGIATIQYTTSLGAVIGSHTLAARYAGGSVPPSQKTATLNVTSAGNCKENQNAAICITVSPTTNLDQISSFTINDSSDPVSAMAGTAVTLKANLGVSGQIIFFTDQTASINIGSAVTDSSGIATIQYTTSLGAVIGSHTLAARYAGGSVPPSQKTATLNVTSAGNCKENQNAAICITVSISTTPP